MMNGEVSDNDYGWCCDANLCPLAAVVAHSFHFLSAVVYESLKHCYESVNAKTIGLKQ